MPAPSRRRARRLAFGVAVGLSLGLALVSCASVSREPIPVRLLAINDFHGFLEPTGLALTLPDPADGRTPVRVNTGGAAFLSTRLQQLRSGQAHTLTLSTGDLIGASPLVSSLFRDEPTIEVMNAMKVELNVVGNHEFDKGLAELRRLVEGGCATDTGDPNLASCAVPGRTYGGARFASGTGRGFLAANVVDESGRTVFPPYAIRRFAGVPVGFIGVVTQTTPTIVVPSGVAGLRFLDEAETLNRYAAELVSQGVQAIVALVHEGGVTDGNWNDSACGNPRGPIFDINRRLAPSIDVVFSGHTHQGYNCRLDGRVVIQGTAFGRAISVVDLVLDPAGRDVDRDRTTARNVAVVNATNPPDVAARFPPVAADPAIQAIVDQYAALAAPRANRVIGRLAGAVTRTPEPASAGDSPAGRLIADAQLAATRAPDRGAAVVAFMNPGGIRADFPCPAAPCDLTFGQAFTVQPFGNSLVVMTLTGAQIKELLEQQATGVNAARPRILQPSDGFTYTWTAAARDGERAGNLRLNGRAIEAAARYRVVVNSFLADGGDGFTVLRQGTQRLGGAQDLDALIAYLRSQPGPVAPVVTPRVTPGLTSGVTSGVTPSATPG
jgi:5'-nucleotidase